jgi:cephalosporin-C deacetylase-like acetyl esterase
VNGSSQGGGLSLVCAGLDARVTAIAANVPAICDHQGYLAGRTPGWPRLVPGPDAPSAAVAPYYDAVNFARHARCESMVCVGLVDLTCPPMGVYAAFNQLPEPKQMVVTPLQGHVVSQEYAQARDALFRRFTPEAP